MKLNKNAFTLIEIMVWILILSIVLLAWFQTLSSLWYWKVKLMEKADITKEAFYFSEKLFDEIKAWWTIDYEEYFNRKIVWTSKYLSWHYMDNTWFWNYWSWGVIWSTNYWNNFYYCTSQNWVSMWTWWCIENWYQRYWEYKFQFIDFNSNMDNDNWDEDWNWKIIWDDDDENLWLWPNVFTWWSNVKEIYLISWDRKKRTLFRWNRILDPAKTKPNWINCDWTWSNIWSWCLWTIQFLKLDWKDRWINHDKTWSWYLDWIIDTWIIDTNFTWWNEIIAWWNQDIWYRQDLFPENMSVVDFQVFAYPEINKKYAWKLDTNTYINPYLKIKISLTPSWKKRWSMKWKVPIIDLTTTINLNDYFSK